MAALEQLEMDPLLGQPDADDLVVEGRGAQVQEPFVPGAGVDPDSPAQAVVYDPNCAALRAAGKAPLYRGQPGYRPGLDRDGDGVACE